MLCLFPSHLYWWEWDGNRRGGRGTRLCGGWNSWKGCGGGCGRGGGRGRRCPSSEKRPSWTDAAFGGPSGENFLEEFDGVGDEGIFVEFVSGGFLGAGGIGGESGGGFFPGDFVGEVEGEMGRRVGEVGFDSDEEAAVGESVVVVEEENGAGGGGEGE